MSSRVAAVLSSCWPTSTRAGRRPPTSSGHPRTPVVCSTHTSRLSWSLTLEPDRIAGALEGVGVQIGYKGARCRRPVKENVGIMRFLRAGSVPFWGFVSDVDTVGRLVGEGGGPLGSSSSAGSTWARFSPAHLAGDERRSRIPSALSTPPTAAARCCRAARAGLGAQA